MSVFLGVTQIRKKIDVTFDDMQWSLTQEDGQLGIATVYVKKFKYAILISHMFKHQLLDVKKLD